MITCQINVESKSLTLFNGGEVVGHVYQDREDTLIVMNHRQPTLSFNDLTIIQDNWNQLEEMVKNTITVKVDSIEDFQRELYGNPQLSR